MGFWKNPFEAPPPIQRAPLPSEDPTQAAREAQRVVEVDVDAVPESRRARQTAQRELLLEFTGDTWEYFRLWTATQALIFVTLGIYSPWAKVRRLRYLARHYRLDGASFEYRANPLAILKGKLLVFGALAIGAMLSFWNPYVIAPLILLAFAPLPWLMTRSFAFRWQTLRYRNIAFGFTPDATTIFWPIVLMGLATALFFSLDTFPLVGGAAIWLGLLASLLMFLVAWPYLTSKLLHHRFTNARWGNSSFHLNCTVREIFTMLFRRGKGFFFGIAVLFSLLNGLSFLIKNIDLRSLAQAMAYVLLTVCAVAFGRTRRMNFALNRLEVGRRLTFMSTMEPDRAAWRALRYGLASVLTFGLAIPWATVDFARWRAQNLTVRLEGEWSEFAPVLANNSAAGAVVDGLSEQFGIEVGW
ncbi:MAG: YjgN family protein [Casimicrobium sp.]